MGWSAFEGIVYGRVDPDLTSYSVDRTALSAYLAECVLRAKTPGISVGVVDADRTEHFDVLSCGVRDARRAEPFRETVCTRWFSVTKVVTASCVVALADRGVVDLDEPIRDRWDGLPEERRGAPRVTARDLLSHTAGLPHPLPAGWVRPIDEPPIDVDAFARRQLSGLHPAGASKPEYTNLGYLVLECWLERVTGRPFAALMRETILDPLGMTRTCFAPLGPRDGLVATGHQKRDVTAWLIRAAIPGASRYVAGVTKDFYVLHPFCPVGSAYGGLLGPLTDLLRFGAMFLRGGRAIDGRRVLSEQGAAAMTTVWAKGSCEMGLGWQRDGTAWVHEGAAVGSRAALRVDLQQGRAAAVLTPVTSFDVDSACRAALSALQRDD